MGRRAGRPCGMVGSKSRPCSKASIWLLKFYSNRNLWVLVRAYAPIAALLRADAIRPTLSTLADAWLMEIARFVPEVLGERPDLPHPGPLLESWQRQRLFEA